MFLEGIGSALPSDCPWCLPSRGIVYARGPQTVRPVPLYYLSAPLHAVSETPRASPSHATGGGQTARPHRRGPDTGQSTCRAGHTTPATPRPSVALSPYDTAAAAPPRPRFHRLPSRDGHGLPTLGHYG